MAIFVGIDYSLSCPAVAVSINKDFRDSKIYYLSDRKAVTGLVYPNIIGVLHDEYLNDQERYENIANWVLDILNNLKDREIYIMIEDYSFGSKGKVFHIAENCGVLKYLLYKNGYQFLTVPPTVVKKFATGKGNADKQKMFDAFVEETKLDLHKKISPTTKLGSPTTDVVDAWYMSRYMIDTLERTDV